MDQGSSGSLILLVRYICVEDSSIAVVGNITLDTIIRVDGLPRIDDVAFVSKRSVCFGGRGLIPATVASLLGSPVSLCTVVGGASPKELLDWLQCAGVDLRGIIHDQSTETLFEVIVVIGEREQNCVSYFLPKPIQMEVARVHRDICMGASLLYLSTHKRAFNTNILKKCSGRGTSIVHNVSSYFSCDPDYLDLMLNSSSHLIGNSEEFKILCAASNASIESILLQRPNLKAAIVTLGGEGVRIHTPTLPPQKLHAQQAEPRTPVGAGDAFAGGFIHALARQASVMEAAELGISAAAASLESEESCPHADTLSRHIREKPEDGVKV